MTLKRMDNVLIVVDDLEAAKAFFIELGLKLEGETTVEGPSVGNLIGLEDVRATLAMMRTPDGQGIELDKFHAHGAELIGEMQYGDTYQLAYIRGPEGIIVRLPSSSASVLDRPMANAPRPRQRYRVQSPSRRPVYFMVMSCPRALIFMVPV